MENAGRNAAEIISKLIKPGKRALIVAGKGNNGGDGFVIARQVQRMGLKACVCACGTAKEGPAATNQDAWTALQGDVFLYEKNKFIEAIKDCSLIVDALYGTGLETTVRKEGAEIIEAMNESGVPVFAIDLPSGLDCDTGKPLGISVKATWTGTFLAQKKGFAQESSKEYTGEIFVLDIGFEVGLADRVE